MVIFIKDIYCQACAVLLCLLGVTAAHAQQVFPNMFFTHIDSRNGLSENTVKSIVQDSWGFLWFGTKNGLNRYDGSRLKHYVVADPVRRHSNQNISALFEDKNRHLWAGTDKGVFVYDPYTELFTYFDTKAQDGKGITNWISQITADHDGNIWIISPDEGAFRYNLTTKRLHAYHKGGKGAFRDKPECMCVRRNGEVWLGTSGAGLYLYHPSTGQMSHFLTDASGYSLQGKNIYTMADYGEWIAIGEHEGKLVKYNPTTGQFADVDAPSVHYKVIRTLLFDGHELIVGTQDGLYFINEKTGQTRVAKENDMQPNGLSDNMIYTLYRDKDNGIWVGTMQSGVNYMPRQGMLFYRYVPTAAGPSPSNKRIREMAIVAGGDVWIATEEGYINIYHTLTHTFETIATPAYKGGSNRLALMVRGGEVWSGLFKNGLDIIDIKTHKVTHYTPSQLHLQGEGSVYALKQDHRGDIYLGTGNGLYRKKADMTFSKLKAFGDIFCQDMVEDHIGRIWVSTIGSGVYRYNPASGSIRHYAHSDSDTTSISSDDVSSMTIDHKGTIWFSTDRGGICRYNERADNFTSYSYRQGLPDDVAYKILEDSNNNLWFGTNHGLVRFQPGKGKAEVYNNNDQYSYQFNYKSGARTANGNFLFGGSNGLVEFNPRLANKPARHTQVYITNISVDGEETLPGDGKILDTNIVHAKSISLPYGFSTLSLDVSALNYTGIESENIEYKLDGVDKSWNASTTGAGIKYSQLQPGSYKLRIRLAGDDAAGRTLTINVSHPWWSTTLAKTIYTLIAFLLLLCIYRYVQKRQTRLMARRERRFREAQNKELMEAKISFFTDITHELRTPLTLINGSVESIDATKLKNPAVQKNLLSIKKNCRRLLNLINQLLDFRRMDAKSMKLNFVNTDVVSLIRELMSRFEPSISNMNKTISLDAEDDSIVMPVDTEALTKIMSNLLNNARKYSETFIQVIVRKSGDDHLLINVQNDGEKIPADKADAIFQPFTRLESAENMPGSGIGLPLARSLAELHNGTLTIDTLSEYNSFVLRLPMHQQYVITTDDTNIADNAVDMNNAAIEDYEPDTGKTKDYTLLIVEDNAEVMDMIVDNMKGQYNILTAKNGKEGLEKAKGEHVDLIISDVMMPVMDGEEMTRAIKADIEVSHIPIILLTARNTLENRLDGLRAGADAYIEKPFSFAHLKTQADALLANRKRERESFLHKPYLPVQNSKTNKAEEEFMKKISDTIIANLRTPGFNVEQLASEMCMSRSSLHRKIKEVSNLTPIDFIRLIKLKKAAELMREQGYRTNEVCEMVGISSPSYFIKLFQKQFGMTPKEFASSKDKTGK